MNRFMAVFAGTLALAIHAAPATAQCMACRSSTECGTSSQRGGCKIECAGTSCICADSGCRPKPTHHFEPVNENGDMSVFALRGDPTTHLAFACRDRWLGVTFAPTRVRVVRAALALVPLRSSGDFRAGSLVVPRRELPVHLASSMRADSRLFTSLSRER